jgi:hypothetical protein
VILNNCKKESSAINSSYSGQQVSSYINNTGAIFNAIGFFNEADTLESNSILIFSYLSAGSYTQWIGLDAILIKR